jgi:hypothetical protein
MDVYGACSCLQRPCYSVGRFFLLVLAFVLFFRSFPCDSSTRITACTAGWTLRSLVLGRFVQSQRCSPFILLVLLVGALAVCYTLTVLCRAFPGCSCTCLVHSLLFISYGVSCNRMFIDFCLVKGVFSVLLTRRISTRAYVGDFCFDQSPHFFESFTLFQCFSCNSHPSFTPFLHLLSNRYVRCGSY